MPPSNTQPPQPEDRITIVCLYCQQPQEVGRKTINMTCRFCHKSLRLEDVKIKEYQARRSIDTVGIVTVEKKGHVVADKILCGGLIARGKIKANIVSRGAILVGPEADVKGDVNAPSIAIGAGAILEGKYRIGMAEGDGTEPLNH